MISIGQEALISILSHMICITFTWKVMLSINFEPILRKGKEAETRVFLLFIAIVIGAGVSRFILDVLRWSQDLIYLF